MKIDICGSESDYYDFLSSPDSLPVFYRSRTTALDNNCLVKSSGFCRVIVTAGYKRFQFLAKYIKDDDFIVVMPSFGDTTFAGYDMETTELMHKRVPTSCITPSLESPLLVTVVDGSSIKKYANPILKDTFLSYTVPASWIYNGISEYIEKEESK